MTSVTHWTNSDKGTVLCHGLYQELRPSPVTTKSSHTSEKSRPRNKLLNHASDQDDCLPSEALAALGGYRVVFDISSYGLMGCCYTIGTKRATYRYTKKAASRTSYTTLPRECKRIIRFRSALQWTSSYHFPPRYGSVLFTFIKYPQKTASHMENHIVHDYAQFI
ncbi:hypothetical protein STEG23_027203 [Scotinomys teguina]